MKALKSISLVLFALTALLGGANAAYAEAKTPPPAKVCDETNNQEIPSRGGCASTVATGHLSRSAYVSQCKWIRENDPETFYAPRGSVMGVYGFEGKIEVCVEVLSELHGSPPTP